jgi:cytochrome b561
MATSPQRYTAVAIVLHWMIATAIIANFALGWWMHEAIEAPGTQSLAVVVFQIHKSLGLSILLLSLLRLAWRIANPPPPMPTTMPRWEQRVAKATHWAFYGLMIGIPLTGWLYVSTQWRGDTPLNVPTLWFGLFEVPHLFGLNALIDSTRQLLAGLFAEAHEALAFAVALLLVLHIAAALKHHFRDRDAVLSHMIPALEQAPDPATMPGLGYRLVLRLGLALIPIAAIAILLSLFLGQQQTGSNARSIESAAQSEWLIDPANSHIAFSGVHAGTAFKGEFSRWQADIRFQPESPETAVITATIDTASATDGIPLHDETLPQSEWFDVATYPVASVHSSSIRLVDDNRFAIDGELSIKGQTVDLYGFVLQLKGDNLHISGDIILNRRDINLGMESDPQGEWVSLEIPVNLALSATRR